MDITKRLNFDLNFGLYTEFDFSNLIDLITLIVNVFLTIWIVKTVQENQNNKRTLKDLFINDVKEIKNNFSNFYNNLIRGNYSAREIIEWLKIINIKLNETNKFLNEKYGIENDYLTRYARELRELITNHSEFERQFRDQKVIPNQDFKNSILNFYQQNSKIFTNTIVLINDFKKNK